MSAGPSLEIQSSQSPNKILESGSNDNANWANFVLGDV